jgi:ribosomal protein S18 acetylase RimI-like enzyme/predicted double-glycine peptidase
MKKNIVKIQDVLIRPAKVSDIPKLLEIEKESFDYNQLSRRSFHWMIKKANSIFLVLEWNKSVIGQGLVLINEGTSLARLYSIALLKEFHGHGLAKKLLQTLEEKTAEEESIPYLRLEVKASNKKAIGLYESLGYIKFSEKENYYDNGETAYCFEKRIKTLNHLPRLNVPYYQQRTDFTCGPSCLMMALKTFDSQFQMSLSNELQIWREATTIFMTSGHGGCGPRGLALAAWRRGYRAELFLSHEKVLFLETVRRKEKKEVIKMVHEDFQKRVAETNIKTFKKAMTLNDLRDILQRGGVPIVLISTYHFDNNRTPHWVVITAFDDQFVYFHDPDQDDEEDKKGVISRVHIPVPKEKFLKISRWGKDRVSATVVIYEG